MNVAAKLPPHVATFHVVTVAGRHVDLLVVCSYTK